jgi:hypothetical protein
MGAQTRESLAAVTDRAKSVTGVTQDAVSGLFQAGRAIAAYPSLLSALADPGHSLLTAVRCSTGLWALFRLPHGNCSITWWSCPGQLLRICSPD